MSLPDTPAQWPAVPQHLLLPGNLPEAPLFTAGRRSLGTLVPCCPLSVLLPQLPLLFLCMARWCSTVHVHAHACPHAAPQCASTGVSSICAWICTPVLCSVSEAAISRTWQAGARGCVFLQVTASVPETATCRGPTKERTPENVKDQR